MEQEIWNVESLKEYITQRFAEQDRYIDIKFNAAKEAVTKAEVSAEKRFESVNEFRGQLSDQATTFVTRTENDLLHNALEGKINSIEKMMNVCSGKEIGSEVTMSRIYTALGAFAIIVGLIAYFIK